MKSQKFTYHMKAQMARLLAAGFTDYQRQFVRSAIEEAYQQGYRAAQAGRGEIVEDVILKAKSAVQ